MIISPEWVATLETNMQRLQTLTYEGLLNEMWWTRIAQEKESKALKEIIIFGLESAKLNDGGVRGGVRDFDVMSFLQTSYINTYKQSALELTEQQLTDFDGNGVQAATQWVTEITTLQLYQPQKTLAELMLSNSGAGPNAYDGKAFFATAGVGTGAHFTNGRDSTQGTYNNLLTGAASGAYPGACPIHDAIALDVATVNLAKAVAYIRGNHKTPTGYPRNLKVVGLLVPPALAIRAQQLTNARFLPAGNGTADNSTVISNLGLGEPIVAPELGAAFGGSDTAYYLICQNTASGFGPFVYFNRKPYSIRYHDKITDAELDRADMLQWFTDGRNTMGPFHPFLMHKVLAT